MKTLKIFLAAVMVLSLALFTYPAYAGKSYMTGRTVSVKSGDNGKEDGEKFTTQGFTKPSAMAVDIYGINTNAVAPDQTTNYNCAAFSLAALFADKGVSMDDISAALKPYTNEQGYTSLEGLQIVANQLGDKYGLDYEAVKTSFPNLVNDTDAIVHFSYGHYVKLVSYDESSGIVSYKDNGELKTATRDEFESQFSGYALVNKSKADDKDVISNNEAAGVLGAKGCAGTSGMSGGGSSSGSSGSGSGGGGTTGSWGDSRNAGGGMGSYSNNGSGGYSSGGGSSSRGASMAAVISALSHVSVAFSGFDSGLSAAFSSASRSLSSLSSGSNLANISASLKTMSVAMSGIDPGLSSAFASASRNLGGISAGSSLSNMSASLKAMSVALAKVDPGLSTAMISAADTLNGVSAAGGSVIAPGIYKTGEITGKIEQKGNEINVYQEVNQGDHTVKSLVMTGSVENGKYTLYSVGKDGKATDNVMSSGTWNGKVAQNIQNNMYDPGHMIIASAEGEKMNIDLSDGSYVINKGNTQLGAGSPGSLAHNNLQVYASIFAAGHSIPSDAARLLAGMPGKPLEWTYTSSKDNIDFYENRFTGQTIQLVNENPQAPAQFSWKGSDGQIFSQINLEQQATAKEQASLQEKFSEDYGKYENRVNSVEDILGVNTDPKNLSELETLLKSVASLSGTDVKATVGSAGTTYTQYLKDSNGEIIGKNVYDFIYDNQKAPKAGKVTVYENRSGNFVEKETADIDAAGNIINKEERKAAETDWKPIPGVDGAWTDGVVNITPLTDPKQLDPNYYIENAVPAK